MLEKETKERWENYRKANTDKPLVRENELKDVFKLVSPKSGERILEVGTGNGYLTFPIAQAVGENGNILTADVVDDNLQSIAKHNKGLPVDTFLFNDKDLFSSIESERFDAVVSIATLHHFDSKKDDTGENGRTRALKDFYRVLKSGGRLVFADVASNTISQKYFNAIDNPEHCYPEGHPHDFFSVSRLETVLKGVGFRNIKIEIKKVPWRFKSLEEAQNFIHTIHNAKCSIQESFSTAKEYLGFNKVGDHYELGWELLFVIAYK